MTELPRAVRRKMLLRSLAVQGSWNYETLIGTGFAFTLIPALRHLSNGDEGAFRDAVLRHATLFNSHPYLATVAAGAVVRLEADHVDPHTIERFKSALRGSLGAIGDQLVWGAWRPAVGLLAIVLLLAGAAWWVGLSVFLVVYNALHLRLRGWGLRIGRDAGLEVGKRLRDAPLQELARRAADAGAVLAGIGAVLAGRWALLEAVSAGPAPLEVASIAAVAAAAGVGIWLGARARRWLAGSVVMLAGVAILLGSIG